MSKNTDITSDYFITPDGQKLAIHKEGSLGLLAYGAKGLEAWRAVRKKKVEEMIKKDKHD